MPWARLDGQDQPTIDADTPASAGSVCGSAACLHKQDGSAVRQCFPACQL